MLKVTGILWNSSAEQSRGCVSSYDKAAEPYEGSQPTKLPTYAESIGGK